MKDLINILEKSTKGINTITYKTKTKDDVTAICSTSDQDLLVMISPVEQDAIEEIFEKELHNLYEVSIQTVDIDKTTFEDVESIIAKANWFISDPNIKTHVFDMPDGLTCQLTLEVLNPTKEEELTYNIPDSEILKALGLRPGTRIAKRFTYDSGGACMLDVYMLNDFDTSSAIVVGDECITLVSDFEDWTNTCTPLDYELISKIYCKKDEQVYTA